MSIKTVTHINFRGNADQALTFYNDVFDGQKTAVTYQQAGVVHNTSEEDQIMWGQVTSEKGFTIMAYDVPSNMTWAAGDKPFFVSVRGDIQQELKEYWDKLIVGGEILHTLGPSEWSPLYGMVKDRFGIIWVLDLLLPY